MYDNPWYYNGTPLETIPEGAIGFVYIIINTITGKRYIGKKNFYFTKTKQVKGKKKRYKAESDWKEYYSSSEIIKKEISESGYTHLSREILRICYSKAEFSYYEAKYQFEYDVLLKPDEFLNDWISVRVRRAHLKKLQLTLNEL